MEAQKCSKVYAVSDKDFSDIISGSTNFSEVERKLGYLSKGGGRDLIRQRCLELGLSIQHFTGKSQVKKRKWTPEEIFIEDSPVNQTVLRKWFKQGNYTPYICSICGQKPFWNGKELTLTLDHINGNNHDDRLENLRWVCPNCDRQLPTFGSKNPFSKERYNKSAINICKNCGKEITAQATLCSECYNKLRKSKIPSKEELENFLNFSKGNFTQAGLKYGVSDNAIRKWCKNYILPFHSKDYKQE